MMKTLTISLLFLLFSVFFIITLNDNIVFAQTETNTSELTVSSSTTAESESTSTTTTTTTTTSEPSSTTTTSTTTSTTTVTPPPPLPTTTVSQEPAPILQLTFSHGETPKYQLTEKGTLDFFIIAPIQGNAAAQSSISSVFPNPASSCTASVVPGDVALLSSTTVTNWLGRTQILAANSTALQVIVPTLSKDTMLTLFGSQTFDKLLTDAWSPSQKTFSILVNVQNCILAKYHSGIGSTVVNFEFTLIAPSREILPGALESALVVSTAKFMTLFTGIFISSATTAAHGIRSGFTMSMMECVPGGHPPSRFEAPLGGLEMGEGWVAIFTGAALMNILWLIIVVGVGIAASAVWAKLLRRRDLVPDGFAAMRFPGILHFPVLFWILPTTKFATVSIVSGTTSQLAGGALVFICIVMIVGFVIVRERKVWMRFMPRKLNYEPEAIRKAMEAKYKEIMARRQERMKIEESTAMGEKTNNNNHEEEMKEKKPQKDENTQPSAANGQNAHSEKQQQQNQQQQPNFCIRMCDKVYDYFFGTTHHWVDLSTAERYKVKRRQLEEKKKARAKRKVQQKREGGEGFINTMTQEEEEQEAIMIAALQDEKFDTDDDENDDFYFTTAEEENKNNNNNNNNNTNIGNFSENLDQPLLGKSGSDVGEDHHEMLSLPSTSSAVKNKKKKKNAKNSKIDKNQNNNNEESFEESNETDPLKRSVLNYHNKLRAQHGAPPLQWHDDCATFSQKCADNCTAQKKMIHGNDHGELGSHGQNIFFKSARKTIINGKMREEGTDWNESEKIKLAEEGIQSWYDEMFDPGFDFSKDGMMQKGTGHFTQLVWSSSKYVGLSFSPCGKFVVANYYPAGNIAGQFQECVHEKKKNINNENNNNNKVDSDLENDDEDDDNSDLDILDSNQQKNSPSTAIVNINNGNTSSPTSAHDDNNKNENENETSTSRFGKRNASFLSVGGGVGVGVKFPSEARLFRRRFGLMFKEYHSKCYWFYAVELLFCIACGIFEGIRLGTNSCVAGAILFLLASLAYLGLMWIRAPVFNLRIDRQFTVAVCIVHGVAALFYAMAVFAGDDSTAMTVALFAVVVTCCIVIFKCSIHFMFWFYKDIYEKWILPKLKKMQEEKRRQEEERKREEEERKRRELEEKLEKQRENAENQIFSKLEELKKKEEIAFETLMKQFEEEREKLIRPPTPPPEEEPDEEEEKEQGQADDAEQEEQTMGEEQETVVAQDTTQSNAAADEDIELADDDQDEGNKDSQQEPEEEFAVKETQEASQHVETEHDHQVSKNQKHDQPIPTSIEQEYEESQQWPDEIELPPQKVTHHEDHNDKNVINNKENNDKNQVQDHQQQRNAVTYHTPDISGKRVLITGIDSVDDLVSQSPAGVNASRAADQVYQQQEADYIPIRKFCTSCGSGYILGKEKFCSECGSSLPATLQEAKERKAKELAEAEAAKKKLAKKRRSGIENPNATRYQEDDSDDDSDNDDHRIHLHHNNKNNNTKNNKKKNSSKQQQESEQEIVDRMFKEAEEGENLDIDNDSDSSEILVRNMNLHGSPHQTSYNTMRALDEDDDDDENDPDGFKELAKEASQYSEGGRKLKKRNKNKRGRSASTSKSPNAADDDDDEYLIDEIEDDDYCEDEDVELLIERLDEEDEAGRGDFPDEEDAFDEIGRFGRASSERAKRRQEIEKERKRRIEADRSAPSLNNGKYDQMSRLPQERENSLATSSSPYSGVYRPLTDRDLQNLELPQNKRPSWAYLNKKEKEKDDDVSLLTPEELAELQHEDNNAASSSSPAASSPSPARKYGPLAGASVKPMNMDEQLGKIMERHHQMRLRDPTIPAFQEYGDDERDLEPTETEYDGSAPRLQRDPHAGLRSSPYSSRRRGGNRDSSSPGSSTNFYYDESGNLKQFDQPKMIRTPQGVPELRSTQLRMSDAAARNPPVSSTADFRAEDHDDNFDEFDYEEVEREKQREEELVNGVGSMPRSASSASPSPKHDSNNNKIVGRNNEKERLMTLEELALLGILDPEAAKASANVDRARQVGRYKVRDDGLSTGADSMNARERQQLDSYEDLGVQPWHLREELPVEASSSRLVHPSSKMISTMDPRNFDRSATIAKAASSTSSSLLAGLPGLDNSSNYYSPSSISHPQHQHLNTTGTQHLHQQQQPREYNDDDVDIDAYLAATSSPSWVAQSKNAKEKSVKEQKKEENERMKAANSFFASLAQDDPRRTEENFRNNAQGMVDGGANAHLTGSSQSPNRKRVSDDKSYLANLILDAPSKTEAEELAKSFL